MGKRFILFILACSLTQIAIPLEKIQSPVRDRLRCDVLVKGTDFFYMLNIYPSDKNPKLFRWEAVIKHIKSGKILSVLRGSSMRGQENIFERGIRPDGSKITITCSIDSRKPIINYLIQRTREKNVIYSYKGKKEIHLSP